MGITNQQIVDWLKEAVEAQRQATQMFTATVDRFIEHDRENHAEFRQAILLLQADQRRQREDRETDRAEQRKLWGRVWTVVVAPILGGVVIAVLALILK